MDQNSNQREDAPRHPTAFLGVALVAVMAIAITAISLFVVVSSVDQRTVNVAAAAAIAVGQSESWEQSGRYETGEIGLQEMNPDIEQYLSATNLDYRLLDLTDDQLLFSVSVQGMDGLTLVRVLMNQSQIETVTCANDNGGCADNTVLRDALQ